MARIYNSITELIGNTPLLRLNKLKAGIEAEVLVKLESFNPCASVKDRIGFAMIKDAEEKGFLKPGGTIIMISPGRSATMCPRLTRKGPRKLLML